MTRVATLNQRYAASAALARTGIEIVAVGDPTGARFNAAVRRLVALVKEDGGGYLDDLAGASKALRWRWITQPQPLEFNPGLRELANEVSRQAARLRGAIADQELLDELAAASTLVASSNSAIGQVLLRSIEEVGADSSIVIGANKRAASGLESWLQEHGVPVFTAGDLERNQPDREQAYVIGPPRIYRPSLVTAPVTSDVSFLVPAWFQDREVPRSAIAAHAEGAIRVEARVFTVGSITESESDVTELEDDEVYLPQPLWGIHRSDDSEPTSEEVDARKVILSGNLAMWLDDGERIRSLDPRQPRGERVTYTDVAAVREGIYLLLRQGATERGVLYQAALDKLGPQAEVIGAAQAAWKKALAQRLRQHGYRRVVKDLRSVGIKAADRARAWTDPSLIRPNSDQDFARLLQWLGLPVQPMFGYATRLRKTLYLVSAGIGKQLEAAVVSADLSELETAGYLSLDIDTEGFRGIIATRVLAISPFTEIVSRHDARVPFEDRSGKWLE
jgi:hypothetical protein